MAIMFSFIFGITFIVIGILVLLSNYIYVVGNILNKKRGIQKHYSFIPLVAPIFILLGVHFSPMQFNWYYWFVTIADLGTLVLILSLPKLIKEIFSTN